MKRPLFTAPFFVVGMFIVASFTYAACAQTAPPGSAAKSVGPTTAPAVADLATIATIPAPAVPLPAGMTPLFDGKTLAGWNAITNKNLPGESWIVKNVILASLGVDRGVIYTTRQFTTYRIIFDMRHVSGKPDHQACVLIFCTAPQPGEKPLDAVAGIQLQPPNGGHWDYRPPTNGVKHNNAANDLFTAVARPKFDAHQWSRVELLVDSSAGTARMAIAQPVGSKAVEVLDFKDPTAGKAGPFAIQMHNAGLFDEYANFAVEENPKTMELITTK